MAPRAAGRSWRDAIACETSTDRRDVQGRSRGQWRDFTVAGERGKVPGGLQNSRRRVCVPSPTAGEGVRRGAVEDGNLGTLWRRHVERPAARRRDGDAEAADGVANRAAEPQRPLRASRSLSAIDPTRSEERRVGQECGWW